MPVKVGFWLLAMLASLAITSQAALAQTGPSLMLKPWDSKPTMAETYDEPIFIYGGHIKESGGSIGILQYDSFGRIKPQKDLERPDFSIGYDINVVGVDSYYQSLTTGYADVSIALAYHVGELAKDWDLSVMVGGGQSNDDHFDNNDAYYGIAGAAVTHIIDDQSSLAVGISYSGNRILLPDVPLPYAMYTRQLAEHLKMEVGVPYSLIEWEPVTDLTLSAGYTFPYNFALKSNYVFNENWSIFGDCTRTVSGFYLNDQGTNRIFYDLSQVKAGVRFIYGKWIDVAGGVGWAFDQQFSGGYQYSDTNIVATPTDTPIIFIRVQGTF